LLALALKDGALGRVEGVVLLAAYGAYVMYLLREGRTEAERACRRGRKGSARPARAPQGDAGPAGGQRRVHLSGRPFHGHVLESIAGAVGGGCKSLM
jgi:Ca2+/Na+ antiporter